MKTEGFVWILKHLKEDLKDSVYRRSFFYEINPDHPCPDYRKQQIILTEDVMEKIDIYFNELIDSMEGDD